MCLSLRRLVIGSTLRYVIRLGLSVRFGTLLAGRAAGCCDCSDMEKVLEQLTRDGVGKPIGPIQTAIGTIYGFVDPNGHKFAILDKKN